MTADDRYSSPLADRYASAEMSYVFSARHKFTTWRRLWIALAEAQRDLGLSVTSDQIDEMKAQIDELDRSSSSICAFISSI